MTSQDKKPIVEKRIINLSDMPSKFSHLFFENGKFKKIFRNPIKIGEGSFGTVLEAYNVVEGQMYALKKIYIKDPNKKME